MTTSQPDRLDRIEVLVERFQESLVQSKAENDRHFAENEHRLTENERQYRGMVQAVAAMADAHREFMQRTTDRLERIEKIVESNAKSIQALSG